MLGEKYPHVATELRELAEQHAEQDPTFQTSIAYTRLTAQAALKQLQLQGFSAEQLPAPSAMAVVLNRVGLSLAPSCESQDPKKLPETDAIFDNIKAKDPKQHNG